MSVITELVFVLGVVFILIHELDAIQQREWRFFFAPFPIRDEVAYRLFLLIHVLLFWPLLWYLDNPGFQIGFDLFLIIHAGLHWFLRHHPLVEFNSWFSRLWIFGGAGLGILHLMLLPVSYMLG